MSEVSARIMIGESAGLTFRYVGLLGMLAGRFARAALMAACTSRAAPSMFRVKSNCIVIEVEPRSLAEVISVTPAMWPSCRSSGAATEDAMISGLAPGSEAPTVIPLEGRGDRVAVHAVCRENVFWETLEELKKVGASSVLVLPVEKMLA